MYLLVIDPCPPLQRHEIRLPAEPASVARARKFLRSCTDGVVDDPWRAELLLSELATNVVKHAKTEFTVSVRASARLRVEVSDGSSIKLAVREATADAEDGRGLAFVEQLADEWGVDERPGSGKSVWFEIEFA